MKPESYSRAQVVVGEALSILKQMKWSHHFNVLTVILLQFLQTGMKKVFLWLAK